MQKLRVGVLMGGKNIEKEVSFNSGRTVCDHLDTARYEIIPLFQREDGKLFLLPWHFLHRGKTTDFVHRLATEAQELAWDDLRSHIDFIYIAMHGRYAEDGTLQGFLELLNIPYLGSDLLASALCMDKAVQKDVLRNNNIDVPRGINLSPQDVVRLGTNLEALTKQMTDAGLKLPVIVKPHLEGSSLGISVIYDAHEIIPAINLACNAHPETKQTVIIEEFIEGMEFSCITLTNYKTGKAMPLPPTEIIPEQGSKFFDYEQKYMPGRATKFTPARCDQATLQAIQQTCIRAQEVLGITNISRIDGFVTRDNRIVIIDPNTLSGMGPTSFLFRQAAEVNMSHTDVINHLIETELQAYGMLDAILEQEKALQQTMDKKIRVAVIMGGNSNEREISLESGRNVTYKLSPQKYEVIPLFLNNDMELFQINQSLLVHNSTKEIMQNVNPASKIRWNDLPTLADFVFIGLHGGLGENGGVQGTLEMLGIPYNGSGVLASALCMNKFKANQFLRGKGFEVPNGLLVAKDKWMNDKDAVLKHITDTIPAPWIVKPHDDGCSVMVQKIKSANDLAASIEQLYANGKEHALVEECIMGMELTVGVIGNENPQALPPSQAVTASDILSIEEKFLPGAGENQTPAPLPADALAYVQKVMEGVYQAVSCKGYARIDCFYQSATQSPTGAPRVIIIELNTLPGLTPATCIFHQAAEVGLRPMDLIDKIVQFGFEAHGTKNMELARMHANSVDLSPSKLTS